MFIFCPNNTDKSVYLSDESQNIQGFENDFFIVARTFIIDEHGNLQNCPKDDVIPVSQDVFFENELSDVIKKPDDFTPPLDQIDLIVHANAYAPSGTTVTELEVEVATTNFSKRLRVVGDRTYIKYKDETFELTAPNLFSEMPIRVDKAFGGAEFEKNEFGKGFLYNEKHDPLFKDMLTLLEEAEEAETENAQTLEDQEPVNEDPMADNIPEAKSTDTQESSVASVTDEIDFTVEAPNIEYFKRPYENPYNAADVAGFFCVKDGWVGALVERYSEELITQVGNDQDDSPEIEFDTEFSNVPPDQRLKSIQPGELFSFKNMVQDKEIFTVQFPVEYPRLFIASRDQDLELIEYDFRQNTVYFDLVENRLSVVWKAKMQLSGKNATAKDFNAKYAFVSFETADSKKDMDQIQIEFSDVIEPFEKAELVAAGPTEEALNQKLSEMAAALVKTGEQSGVPEEVLSQMGALEGEEALQDFFNNTFEESLKGLEELIEETRVQYDLPKNENPEDAY
jgi:hypothetical protein